VADTEHIGKLVYFPQDGMNKKYFPYKVMPNYHQPIVRLHKGINVLQIYNVQAMVKFESLAQNVIVQVECLAYAYNIIHDPIDRMGLIHFEILIDSPKTSGGKS
jgi:hypothetical protein